MVQYYIIEAAPPTTYRVNKLRSLTYQAPMATLEWNHLLDKNTTFSTSPHITLQPSDFGEFAT